MNTYKVYWTEDDGFGGYTYIEAATPKKAKAKFFEMGYGGKIVRVVKDC